MDKVIWLKKDQLVFLKKLVLYIILIAIAVTMLVPFFWMVSTSLKSRIDVFDYPPQWIPRPPKWENYRTAWKALPFGRYFANTIVVAVSVMFLQLLTSSLAAYAFARLNFPGRDRLFLCYLGTMMIPGQVLMIPRFIIIKYLGWVDSYTGLILPQAFTVFGTFLLRQFFMTIPRELEDAAKIDGCSHFRIYLRIILPLSKPALATLGIFAFMTQWNDFLWPLIVIDSREMYTLTTGLSFFQGLYLTRWTLLMAGAVIVLIPIIVVYVLGQKYFVKGITLSGLGGR